MTTPASEPVKIVESDEEPIARLAAIERKLDIVQQQTQWLCEQVSTALNMVLHNPMARRMYEQMQKRNGNGKPAGE